MNRLCLLLIGLSLPLTIGSCGPTIPHAEDHADSAHELDHEHHAAGPHGGTIIDWGGGKFHVELIVDHDRKNATVYILGSDEKTPAPVKATDVFLNIDEPEFEVELVPHPLPGETGGASSRFVGTHDKLATIHKVVGEISGLVDGTPYFGDLH